MTDISRTRKHNSNPFQAIIRNSKTVLLFLAVVLPNDSPRTMIVNRGTLSGIPNERDDGKGMIGGPIKKILGIGLGPNGATVLLFQPIGLSHKTSD